MAKKSKAYKANQEKIAAVGSTQNVEQAVETLLSLDHPKFKEGASVELHFNLNIDPTKSDQLIRTSVSLPHGNGKEIKVAAFVTPENEAAAKDAGADMVLSEVDIEKIKTSGKIDFDIAVAEPAMMKVLAKVARVLGTAGVMPSPKNGTVGTDLTEMIKPIKAGKVDIKNDKTGNLHVLCGKISKDFDQASLVENVNTVIKTIEDSKPEGVKKKLIESIHLATTYSPSIKIAR